MRDERRLLAQSKTKKRLNANSVILLVWTARLQLTNSASQIQCVDRFFGAL